MPSDPAHQDLLEALDEPVLILSGRKLRSANAAARRLLGRNIVGRDIRLVIRHPQVLELLLAGKNADLAAVGIGGAERPWTIQMRPVDGDSACLVRFVDRSESIAAERMRVDFVANASHELRTPLATISGYAETLAEPDVPPELRQKFAATISGEAARMQHIIEDLMSLSRIEASRFITPDERCELATVARQGVDQIEPLAERKSCDVQLEVDVSAKTSVAGDHVQLLQAVDNLLSNAIRYGGTKVLLSVGVEFGRPYLRVKDNGPGIPAVHLPRITERFYRVDEGRSRGGGGTGLGLAIVKHIVERHRGTLDIRSRPGEGTTVTISLPPA
ncbi:ATPase [Sphingomonas sp. HDW15A]|uniref:ATP-binding protein n=1 Tax=Sphingomonas sp. HDW15A TaxID=2714942 RepID=UPI00140ABC41|nr:ATP-binding protein [Sphingomonas sp. HDW15A]QIK96655.1 ATPase [Sphingomonas sp. HDW15A]